MKSLGLDVGSTTLKCVVLDENKKILYSVYKRHLSRIAEKTGEIAAELKEKFGDETFSVALSGSAGMGIAEKADLPFVQEVYAEQIAVKRLQKGTDAVIELGGEDAKILFLTGGFEMRMNGTCAGGTGAFIDQMASLMKVSPEKMNDLAGHAVKVYDIASRCGVFAKSDVQPLLNQGARREDIAAGIFHAVVSQTVAGLAQGREITGKILYLGGPLTFFPYLRKAFDEVLGLKGICPENSLYYVALGACFSNVGKPLTADGIAEIFNRKTGEIAFRNVEPLFRTKEEYEAFRLRHEKAQQGIAVLAQPKEEMALGIDAGSTTVKLLLCDREGNVFRPFYSSNNGNPVPLVRKYLEEFYRDYPDVKIVSSAVTGYGENLIRNAFNVDFGIVETVAHYTAAKKFRPNVDFILDIGGQDIKCFRIRNDAIDSLYLNEACSSGCGSFLQTFASALGYTPAEFSRLALFADHPVDLGSRCTVFMNSSVKQAQKDGASVENIAAGLSVSVVKNALYKVIRCANGKSLGKNVVVQGGTFKSDAVLRAFEQEIGADVIRPALAELMGAYGCALYAFAHAKTSSLLTAEDLAHFVHEVKSVVCKGCTNRCSLTVNDFGKNRIYIAGNRCSKGAGKTSAEKAPDLYEYKLSLLSRYRKNERTGAETVGLPMVLNFYELLPFWHAFFKAIGKDVVVSPFSTRALYLKGQHDIPSDTACYPAKLVHGHIAWLTEQKPDFIFYPDMSYNVDEGLGVNHFNCPLVAYYPQVVRMNAKGLNETGFICDFVSLADKKQFAGRIREILRAHGKEYSAKEIAAATNAAYAEYEGYLSSVRKTAGEYVQRARKEGKPVVLLAGRPYHADPEINHGIHSLIAESGAYVLSEDGVSDKVSAFPVDVRNQWTYHARLYAAAKFVAEAPSDLNIALVQLVSFGCGVDAITTDEVRSIIERAGKVYTQIKIDEISNMGAVTIRLRSLFAVMNERKGENG
ncbi:MAG: acyl-CoA dehydratase activase-related protein [Candidatus Borkfalkiaceae bacterium]|nr:acyl-CoA dehydratase activase-related protein [Christensenellaceae bacterium]